ncbi:Ig-like domain-containing protein [Herbiconiux sp. 11R-BC]|uniref:Ig-like domain-containing protein n=1 Tax=Herbiconiux sp. 11R-BC TaxID=3111637 RepID=UPI003C057D39
MFNTDVESVEYATVNSPTSVSTYLRAYRRDVNGRLYLGGEMRVRHGLDRSYISFYSYLFSRGGAGSFYQEAYYDSKMPCSDGYTYQLSESLVPGDSPANPTPLLAPGSAAGAGEPVMARGLLAQVPSTDEYILRIDVTNNGAAPAPASVSLLMNDFDVENVLATSGGVDCPPAAKSLQKCSVYDITPGASQSMTLLLRAHAGIPAEADIPIILAYRTTTGGTGRLFYSVSRPDPVPAPPACPAAGRQTVVAGLLTPLTTFCHSERPMAVTAAHGTASITAYGAISYTADPAYRGTDTLTVTASSARGRVSAPTTIDVTVADPPHAEADSYTTFFETPLTAGTSVLENDSIFGAAALPLPDRWYAQQGTTPPAHGTVVLQRDGTFVYTPDDGFSGTDSFRYRVEGPDSAASNAVTVNIEVVVP